MNTVKTGDTIFVEQAWEDETGNFHDEFAEVLAIDEKGLMKLKFARQDVTDWLAGAEFNSKDFAPVKKELTEREIFDSFVSTACQCGKPKKSRMSHCRSCYHALPPEAKKALYQRFGAGYEEAYRKSLEILNEK